MELNGKKVMVTGGAGFIGSTLVRELLAEGAEVLVLDSFTSGDLSNLEEVADRIEVVEGDIRDRELANILRANGIQVIFNLAAEAYIPYCYDRPREFFEINADGALNVLLAAEDTVVERVLQYSSSEVYGSAMYVPMDEHHPTLPLSTYAVAKLAADRLCYTLHRERQIPVIILRQFNVYGPRETQPYVIPEIISQLARSNRLRLGNTRARRDLTYVDDAVRGAVALAKCDDALGEVVNLGTGRDWSIDELARTLGKVMGYDEIEITLDAARLRPLDVERLQCNYFKMHMLTGWKPQVELVEGLRRTVEDFQGRGHKWLWENKMAQASDLWRRRD